MAYDYAYYLRNMPKECEALKEAALKNFFREQQEISKIDWRYLFCFTPFYQGSLKPIKRTVQICDLLGIGLLERNKDYLLKRIDFLEDQHYVSSRANLVMAADDIKKAFGDAQAEIEETISRLQDIETERLSEAIDTFLDGCYCSTVAMSVCAVEHRLLKLMAAVCPQEKEKLQKLTLGELIGEYLKNKDKYQTVVPKKYESLLNLCNEFRIFAVHPKKERMTKTRALTILSSTFEFLLGAE